MKSIIKVALLFYYKLQPSQSLSSNQSTAGSLSRHWREPLMVWREILVANQSLSFLPCFFFFFISPLLPFTGFFSSPPSLTLFGENFSLIYRYKLKANDFIRFLTRPVILLLICFYTSWLFQLSAIIVTGAYFNIVSNILLASFYSTTTFLRFFPFPKNSRNDKIFFILFLLYRLPVMSKFR